MTWEAFVIAYGRGARADHLAHVVDQPEAAVRALRGRGVCRPGQRREFAELFTLWKGRAPSDEEWPAPRRAGGSNYEWLLPELTLLATMVGQMGTAEIARVLTARLQKVTGDPAASRPRTSVCIKQQRIGLQTTDIVGGLTVSAAVRKLQASPALLHHEIRVGRLTTRRVGRLIVIPRDVFARWEASRVQPPAGYVRLSSLRERLGIRSDSKLPEFASAGYIPTAVRVAPFGGNGSSSKFGTWYVDGAVARRLVADRRAGRPMPWHGKPLATNLQMSWKKWQKRRHPVECGVCTSIWGSEGPPETFEAFSARYPELRIALKRHLTQRWHPGLAAVLLEPSSPARAAREAKRRYYGAQQGATLTEVAAILGKSVSWIEEQIDAGVIRPRRSARDRRRRCITFPMFRRLADEALNPRPRPRSWVTADWILLHEASHLAGVTISSILKWAERGDIRRRKDTRYWRYDRRTVKSAARGYWKNVRFKRATPPAWLASEAA